VDDIDDMEKKSSTFMSMWMMIVWMDETNHMDENGPYFMTLNIHIP